MAKNPVQQPGLSLTKNKNKNPYPKAQEMNPDWKGGGIMKHSHWFGSSLMLTVEDIMKFDLDLVQDHNLMQFIGQWTHSYEHGYIKKTKVTITSTKQNHIMHAHGHQCTEKQIPLISMLTPASLILRKEHIGMQTHLDWEIKQSRTGIYYKDTNG